MFYRASSYPAGIAPSEIDIDQSPGSLGFLSPGVTWALGSGGSMSADPLNPGSTVLASQAYLVIRKPSQASFLLCYSALNMANSRQSNFDCYTGTGGLGTPTRAESSTIVNIMKQDFQDLAVQLAAANPRYGIKDGRDRGKVVFRCPAGYVANLNAKLSMTSGANDCVTIFTWPELAMSYRVWSYPIDIAPSEINLNQSPGSLGLLDTGATWVLGNDGSMSADPLNPGAVIVDAQSYLVVTKPSRVRFLLCYSASDTSGNRQNNFGCYTGTGGRGTPTQAEFPTIVNTMKQDFQDFAVQLATANSRYGIKDGRDRGKVVFRCPAGYVVNSTATLSPTSGENSCMAASGPTSPSVKK